MICCARAERRRAALPLLTVLLTVVATGSAADCNPSKRTTVGELTNPFLGPQYAQWPVGAISCLLSDEAIGSFLSLASDGEAERFIADFWGRHAAIRETFDTRIAEADKRYSEAGVSGSRTDRGSVHVIYGPPENIEFEDYRDVDEPVVERWQYGKKALPGLDGRKPPRAFRFSKTGDLTTFHRPPPPDTRRSTLSQPRADWEPPP